MRLMTNKGKNEKRRAYTLVEALFSLACIAIVMAAILSLTRFVQQSSITVQTAAFAESYIVYVAESISNDLNNGVDILSQDYTELLANPSVNSTISVHMQEDPFGGIIYQVIVDAVYGVSIDRQVARFFLRGDA